MRKSIAITTVICMILYGSTTAQVNQFVTQVPEKPKAGDDVVITYNALSDKATFKNAKEITLYVLWFDKELFVKELKMTNTNNVWMTGFKAPQIFFAYYFDDGTNQEYNQGESWYSIIWNEKNKPAYDTYRFLGMLYDNNPGFEGFLFNKSSNKSMEYLSKELTSYPSNAYANDEKWSLMLQDNAGDNTVEIIKKELNKVYELSKNDEKKIYTLLPWFTKTNQQTKTEEIKNAFLKANPNGYIAQMNNINAIRTSYYNTPWDKHSNFSAFIDTCNKVLIQFPGMIEYDKDRIYGYMVNIHVWNNDLESATNLMKNWKTIKSDVYNEMAWQLIENKMHLETALKWANEAMKMVENPDITSKPIYISTKTWNDQNTRSLAMIADTYAYGLFQLGYTVAAEPYYEKSYNGSNEDVNARYVECLVTNGNYNKAIEVSKECLLKSKANESLLKNYRTAWIKINGSEKGFDAKIAQFNSKAKDEAIDKLKKEMLNKPAIDFTLKSMDGQTVKLSDLKGKIVVLDFWATWCGPCIASFPALQKINDKYKSNPNIVILAINVLEKENGDAQIAKVKEFIEKKQYTFTILLDEDAYTKYEVQGIPNKFIIDRYGKIQFHSVGFEGEAKMLTEMEAQFEILLNDDYLKDLK